MAGFNVKRPGAARLRQPAQAAGEAHVPGQRRPGREPWAVESLRAHLYRHAPNRSYERMYV